MATAACVRCAQQQQQKQQQQHAAHAQQQQRRNSPRILHIYCAWALITLLAASAAMVQSAAVFG